MPWTYRHVPQIAPRVHDDGDRLEALRATQPAGNPGREAIGAHIARSHRDRFGEIEPGNFSEEFCEIERLRGDYRVKCHRKTRRSPKNPTKSTENVAAASAQRSMLQLEVDRVVVADLATNGLDMFVAKLSNATVIAAQQELVQVKDSHIENVVELSLKTARIGCNTAQIVVGRHNGEPAAGNAAGAQQRRRAWMLPGPR